MSTAKTTSNSAGVQTSKGPEERILMVDEDPISLQLLRETLKGLGCSLLAVTVAQPEPRRQQFFTDRARLRVLIPWA